MNKKNKNKLLVVCGPTATGKSDLAVKLAKEFNGEIISCDSRQVYKGMDLGTGKITEEEMQGIPHYLLDVESPKNYFTVSQFKELADKKIDEILKRGKLPILCGGTGFYIQAIIDDLVIPKVEPNWKLKKELEKKTLAELQQELQEKDPQRWERMNESDRQNKRRLTRALEIIHQTGEKVPNIERKEKYDSLLIGITTNLKILRERIHKRLIKRLEMRMVDEIKNLHELGISWERLDDFGLEYRFIAKYLQNKITYEEMIILLENDIYHFARRQMTWFRKDKRVYWFDIEASKWDNEVEKLIKEWIMPRKIEISHRTIIFTVFFLISLWLLVQVKEIILVLFIAFIFMSALNPAVDRLTKYRLPRWLAILILYVIIFSTIGGLLALIITPLVDQTINFINRLTTYLQETNFFGIDPSIWTSQISQLGVIPGNILSITVGIFSNIVSIFFIAIITFYLLLERKNLNHYLILLLGEGKETKGEELISKIETRIGGWVRGELILMSVIGLMVYLGLKILGIEFALPLAILAGFLEVLPTIGPIVSAVPGILLGFTISPIMGLAVAALYFLVQQLENSIVAPKIMEKVTGVKPLLTIIALSVGYKLSGVAGAVLAVPIVLVLQVIISELSTSGKFKSLTSE